jgi:hypothetical protein
MIDMLLSLLDYALHRAVARRQRAIFEPADEGASVQLLRTNWLA